MSTLGFIYIHVFDTVDQIQSAKGQLEKVSDWRMIRASVLLLFALWILSGIALACSTRWDAIPTLTLCSAVFMLGLMSDYLLGIPAKDGSLIASFLYVVVPNWQLFWMTDALEEGKSIPLSYIGKAFLYTAAYLAASLSLALILFQDRELN
jgi:apolipoprotein N-acyltransferase